MAFVHNTGSFAANPLSSRDRYLQLAHPSLSDVLLLEWIADGNGDGYKLPTLEGLLKSDDRTATGNLVQIESLYKKLNWQDLAFVVSRQQMTLFDQLIVTQSAASPVTVTDRLFPDAPVSKLVLVEFGSKSLYAALLQFLIQFSLKES